MYSKDNIRSKIDSEEHEYPPPNGSSKAFDLITPAANLLAEQYGQGQTFSPLNIRVAQTGGNLIQGSLSDSGLAASLLIGGVGKKDTEVGRAGDDILIGGGAENELKGGDGVDKYVYSIGDTKDIIADSDGKGAIGISTGTGSIQQLKTGKSTANLFTWNDQQTGVQYKFDPSYDGGAIGTLVITGGALGAGQIVIQNFDLDKAQTDSSGYLGIKFQQKSAIVADRGSDPFDAGNYAPADASTNIQGILQAITVYASADSDKDQKVALALNGADASQFKVNLGDGFLDFDSGKAVLTIPAGSDSVTVGLLYTGDPTQSPTVQLTSTLLDGEGTADAGSKSNTLTIAYDLSNAPADPVITSTIVGSISYSDDHSTFSTQFDGDEGNDLVQGNNGGKNIVTTHGGDDSITGGDQNDRIKADEGNNVIAGNGGQDIIYTKDGKNRIYANQKVDLSTALKQGSQGTATGQKGSFISVGNNDNTIVGGNGNDMIAVGSGRNLIITGPGDTTVTAGVKLDGDVADDWNIQFGFGGFVDGIYGGSYTMENGIPLSSTGDFTPTGTYYGSYSQTTPRGMGSDTIFGGSGNDVFWLANGDNYVDGGDGGDHIYGGAGDDIIFSGDGDDFIEGGGGNNILYAEGGDDVIIGEGGNNTIFGGSGHDTLYAGNSENWASSAPDSHNYVEAGTGDTTIYGSGGTDTLVAGSGNDVIRAGDGNATIIGGLGSDKIWGGAGTNLIYAGDGGTADAPTQVVAGSGTTTIFGGNGINHLFGGSGVTVIHAGDGGNALAATKIVAGSGDTTIYGGTGVANIFGGAGNNLIYAGDGGIAGAPTTVNAGDGNTTVYGGAGINIIRGGAGSNLLYAGDGGTDANPTQVFGGSGNSTLVAGAGSAILVGGAGQTTFVVNAGAGNITLVNVKPNDILQFGEGIDPASLGITGQMYADGSNALVINAGSASLVIADGLLSGVQKFQFGSNAPLGLVGLLQQADVASQNIVGENVDFQFSATAGDTLVGSTKNDTIFGFGANDTLVAGDGKALLVGGGGNTTYVVNSATAQTTIKQSTGTDTLRFGSGIAAADIHAIATQAANGSTVVTLQVKNQGTVVIHQGQQGLLGQVAFDDGATASINQLLAQSSANTTVAVHADGSYETTVDDGKGNHTVAQFSPAGLKLSDVWGKADGSHGDDTFNADGSSSGTAAYADGTSSTYTNDGHGTIETQHYAAGGAQTGSTLSVKSQDTLLVTEFDALGSKTGDTWKKTDGSSGSDTFHADGSSSGTAAYADGRTSIYTDDGQGNRHEDSFNAQGIKTGDSWKKADGSHGTDVFNADGSSSGAAYMPDGTYSTYANDGHGTVVTDWFDAQGHQTNETWALPDGASHSVVTDAKGKTTTTVYDANGIKTGDSWAGSDGSHGSDTFNADGSSTSVIYQADGSYASSNSDGLGQTVTRYFNWNGKLTGSRITELHGASNLITSYSNAVGVKMSESWMHSNGSAGTDQVGAVDYNGMTNLVPRYDKAGAKYGNASWQAFDGATGSFSTTVDDQGWRFTSSNFILPAPTGFNYGINGDIWLQKKPGGSFDSAESRVFLPDDSYVETFANSTPYSATAGDGTPVDVAGFFDIRDNVTNVDFFGTLGADGAKYLDGGSYGDDGWFAMPTLKASSVLVPMTETIQGTNGAYSTLKDDGQGNVFVVSYDSPNHKVHDAWFHNDGTSGVDMFNADGTSSGASINADGTVSSYTKDAKGHVVSSHYPDGTNGVKIANQAPSTVVIPDQDPQLPTAGNDWPGMAVSSPDGNGGEYAYVYHGDGSVDVGHVNGQGQTISEGQVQTDPWYGASVVVSGKKYGWIYDVSGVPTASYVDDGQGGKTTYLFNAQGEATGIEVSATDAQGNVQTDLFDVAGNLSGYRLKKTLAPGQVETTVYDTTGFMISRSIEMSDGKGNKVTSNYDGFGYLLSSQTMTVMASGEVMAVNYDAQGAAVDAFVTSVSGTGTINTNTYDGSGKLTGSVVATNDGAGKVTTANYDASGALTTYITLSTDGQGATQITTYDAQGVQIHDNLLQATGVEVSATYAQDGTKVVTTTNPDHTSATVTDDGVGNAISTLYNAQHVKLSDTWMRADGSHGWDTFNQDGSSNGNAVYADGTSSTFTNDGQGTITTLHYDGDGSTLTGKSVTTATADKVITTNFNAAGIKLNDSWSQSDGTSGSDDFTSVQHAPVVAAPIGNQTTDEAKLFLFAIPAGTFSDADAGDTLKYSALQADGTALPDWLGFDAATGVFSGTPGDADTGTLNLKVIATDAGGLAASATFSVAVNNVNEAPILVSQMAGQIAEEGKPFNVVVPANSFADPDAGDSLTYSASMADGKALPAWLKFNPQTGSFSGTPGYADIGMLNVKVSATDAGGLAASEAFTLTVNKAPNLILVGTSGADVLTGKSGNDLLQGLAGADQLAGNMGDDTLDGGTGADTMAGGMGNDTYIVDNAGDIVIENAGEGIDLVKASISYTLGANIESLRLTGTGNLSATGNSGNALIVANSGNDSLTGGSGINVLEGGIGYDTLRDLDGQGVLLGGGGADTILVGSLSDFIAGGTGNDAIYMAAANYVIAFNKGDGNDLLQARPGGSNTLSLGGGVDYSDLSFSKSGYSLILNIAGGDSVKLQDWYANSINHSIATLQIVEQENASYNPASANPLYNSKVTEFDFAKLVAAFDQACAANPSLTSWGLMNEMLKAHLSGSDGAALGGDLALYYGTKGNLSGMDLSAAVAAVQDTQFGKSAQAVHSWSGISQGATIL